MSIIAFVGPQGEFRYSLTSLDAPSDIDDRSLWAIGAPNQCCCFVGRDEAYARCPLPAVPNEDPIGDPSSVRCKNAFCAFHGGRFKQYCAEYHIASGSLNRTAQKMDLGARLAATPTSDLRLEEAGRRFVSLWFFGTPELPSGEPREGWHR